MSKWIVPILVVLFASLAWGQYTTKWTRARYDLTDSVDTVNVWKSLAGGQICKPKTLTIGYDPVPNVWCIGNADGYLYKFNTASQTWTKQTAMGTAAVSIGVQVGTTVWSLQSNTQCAGHNPAQYGIYLWNGAAWAQPNISKCSSFLTPPGLDGTMMSIEANQLSTSTDGGKTWTWLQGSLAYASVFDIDVACAIGTNGKLYLGGGAGNTFVQSASQPSGTQVGCVHSPGVGDSQGKAQNRIMLATWDTTGAVHILNYDSFAWKNVTGLTVGSMAAAIRDLAVALDTSGHPYHYNVDAPYVSGTMTGQWTEGCPGPGQICNPGATHTGRMTIKYQTGHGVNSGAGQQSQTIAYNGSMNLLAWDANPGCDPMFGVPTDVECYLVYSGGAECNQSGANLGGGPSDLPEEMIAHEYKGWLTDFLPIGPYLNPQTGLYTGAQPMGVSDACLAGTVPTCPDPGNTIIQVYWGTTYTEVAVKMSNSYKESPWDLETRYFLETDGTPYCDPGGAEAGVPTYGLQGPFGVCD